MILTETGHPLGQVPRAKNEALARLMDTGKLLFGRLESKSWQGEWLKVSAHIYLRDFSTQQKDCHPARLCYAGSPFSGAVSVAGKVNGLNRCL